MNVPAADGTPTQGSTDTGLAVWFAKRDARWLQLNQSLLLILLILLIAGLLAMVLQVVLMASPGNPPLWVWSYVGGLGSVSYLGLFVLAMHACTIRLEFLRPPADMLGAYADREFFEAVRWRFLQACLAICLRYILPLLLLGQLANIQANELLGSLWVPYILIQLLDAALLAAMFVLIPLELGLRQSGLATLGRTGLALLLLLLSYALPLLLALVAFQALLTGMSAARGMADYLLRSGLLAVLLHLLALALLLLPVLRMPHGFVRS